MSSSAKRRLRKLLKHQGPKQQTEDALRQNDINRRRGVVELMQIRVAASLEDYKVINEWTTIAAVKGEKYAEMEQEHRAWILQELEARVGERSVKWIMRNDLHNRKAETRLLRDTRAMPGRGGIPWVSDSWLNHCFRKHPENLETKEEINAYYQARTYAVNYIAACRRDAGVQGDLESTFTHNGDVFDQINENLGTKQELESLARAELEKIHWQALSSDESDEFTEDEEDEGGVAVQAGESSVQRMPPEPIRADESESDDEDERMVPEPVSGGEEDERMLPEPVSSGEEEEDDEVAD